MVCMGGFRALEIIKPIRIIKMLWFSVKVFR